LTGSWACAPTGRLESAPARAPSWSGPRVAGLASVAPASGLSEVLRVGAGLGCAAGSWVRRRVGVMRWARWARWVAESVVLVGLLWTELPVRPRGSAVAPAGSLRRLVAPVQFVAKHPGEEGVGGGGGLGCSGHQVCQDLSGGG